MTKLFTNPFKKKKKRKKKEKELLISSSLAEPVEEVGGKLYTSWGIISIAILVLSTIGSLLLYMGVQSGNRLIVYGEIVTITIGSIIIIGYLIYKKRKEREHHRGYYAR